MKYEDTVLNLAFLPLQVLWSEDGFSAATVSTYFTMYGNSPPFQMTQKYPLRAFQRKSVSADLHRLYCMGILRRKRVKRTFWVNRRSEPFSKGYMYLYKFTKHGLSYATVLGESIGVSREERKRERVEKYLDHSQFDEFLAEEIASKTNPTLASVAVASDRQEKIPKDGVYARFPLHFDWLLYTKYLKAHVERKQAIAQVEKEKQETDTIIKKYQQILQIEQNWTPAQLLILAKDGLAKNNINPVVYPLGKPIQGDPYAEMYPRFTVQELLRIIIQSITSGFDFTASK